MTEWLQEGVPRWACLAMVAGALLWADWQIWRYRREDPAATSVVVRERPSASPTRVASCNVVQTLRDESRRAVGRPYVARHRRADDEDPPSHLLAGSGPHG